MQESILIRELCDGDSCPLRARAVVTVGEVLDYHELYEAGNVTGAVEKIGYLECRESRE